MRLLPALLAVAAVSVCRANDAENVIAGLIAKAWQPHEVRVEWQFEGRTPKEIEGGGEWEIAEPHPNRLAGSMILVLRREDGQESRMAISGTARVYGKSLVPIRTIRTGETIDSSSFIETEAEWTRLRAEVLDWSAFRTPHVAARTLIPDRPLIATDVRAAPLIARDQTVQVEYVDGAVKIRLRGRALQAGAVGDKIAVAVDLEKTRRVEGIVAADGVVRWVR